MTAPKQSTPGGHDVHTSLAEAERVTEAVQRGSRWHARYLAAMGLVFSGITMSLPYLGGLRSMFVFLAAVLAASLALGVYAWRQPVTPRTYKWAEKRLLPCWAALYLPLAIAGIFLFEHELAYWIPAALATGMPWFVGAWLESRR